MKNDGIDRITFDADCVDVTQRRRRRKKTRANPSARVQPHNCPPTNNGCSLNNSRQFTKHTSMVFHLQVGGQSHRPVIIRCARWLIFFSSPERNVACVCVCMRASDARAHRFNIVVYSFEPTKCRTETESHQK